MKKNLNTPKPIVVIDIDGTISTVGHRARFLELNPIPWDRFYADAFDDEPIAPMCNFLLLMKGKYDIFFCTSRAERSRKKTQMWLEARLGFTPQDYTLIMRSNSDTRPDYIQKIEDFKAETTAEERERVAFVIDDSPTVMFHWRRLGYRTLLIS